MNCCGWSRGDSGEEHEHLSDVVLESVMVFRLAAGAVAEVVVPLGLAKVGFLSGSTGVLGVVAAAEERSEDAKFHPYIAFVHRGRELGAVGTAGVDRGVNFGPILDTPAGL